MKYVFRKIAQTADCGGNFREYCQYEGDEFDAPNDDIAEKTALKIQEKCDREWIENGGDPDSREYECAPSLVDALCRVEIDEDGEEDEIPRMKW